MQTALRTLAYPGSPDYEVLSVQDIKETASQFNMPLIFFKDGQAYSIELDPSGDSISLGSPISPQELIDWLPPDKLPDNIGEMAHNAERKITATL